MANLVYYRNEKECFKEAFAKVMTRSEAEIVFGKLCRHYKLGHIYLRWTSGQRHPKAFGSFKVILNYDINNFGVLCHELAHIRQHRKYGKGRHNKKHWRIMRSMIDYCQRKLWFEAELKRRLTPKAIVEPSKEELKAKLITRLELNCKRYQTKLKLYSNKLKRTQRRIFRLKKN